MKYYILSKTDELFWAVCLFVSHLKEDLTK